MRRGRRPAAAVVGGPPLPRRGPRTAGPGLKAATGGLRTFRHEGLAFDYEDSGGDGEPVVLLHGFPGSHRSWDRMAPGLVGAGYRVLAPDQRGYSPDARPRGRRAYALDRVVGDLLALADAAGTARFHLVGHDWGGVVGWATAAWHSDRLVSLTSLTTPHPRALLGAAVSSTQALRSGYMLLFQLPWLPEAVLTSEPGGAAFGRMLVMSGLSVSRTEDYLQVLRSGAAAPALNWYRAIPFARLDRIGEIRVPTLHVHATADIALGRRAADLTARFVTGPYRFEALQGASHWIPEEHAELATPIVLEHLRAFGV